MDSWFSCLELALLLERTQKTHWGAVIVPFKRGENSTLIMQYHTPQQLLMLKGSYTVEKKAGLTLIHISGSPEVEELDYYSQDVDFLLHRTIRVIYQIRRSKKTNMRRVFAVRTQLFKN